MKSTMCIFNEMCIEVFKPGVLLLVDFVVVDPFVFEHGIRTGGGTGQDNTLPACLPACCA